MGKFKSKFAELYAFDLAFGKNPLAGVDEVGRGALAGPIVGACVAYDLETISEMEEQLFYVRDSKTLNKKKMSEIADSIKLVARHYEIFLYDNDDIDSFGIQQCNRGLFDSALVSCESHGIELLLIDGTIRPGAPSAVPWRLFPQADGKSLAVASASIIAKDYRDTLMRSLDVSPDYGFEGNVGYGAEQHLDALRRLGATEYHRKSFLGKILDA
jgi:ribonuclease HII